MQLSWEFSLYSSSRSVEEYKLITQGHLGSVWSVVLIIIIIIIAVIITMLCQ